MNGNTLDKIQTWCNIVAVGGSIAMVIESAVSRNFHAIGGWLCAAVLAVYAGMAHGDMRFWRKMYFEELANNVER